MQALIATFRTTYKKTKLHEVKGKKGEKKEKKTKQKQKDLEHKQEGK